MTNFYLRSQSTFIPSYLKKKSINTIFLCIMPLFQNFKYIVKVRVKVLLPTICRLKQNQTKNKTLK